MRHLLVLLSLRTMLVAAFLLAFSSLLPAPATAQLPPQVGGMLAGIAKHVKGAVELFPNSGRSKLLAPGDQIRAEDRVTTGFNGQVLIELMDGSVLTLGPNSDLVIDEFVYERGTQDGKSATSILKGVFRYTSGDLSKKNPNAAKMRLPMRTLGIRGTDFVGNVQKNQAEIVLLDPGAVPSGSPAILIMAHQHDRQPVALTDPLDGISLTTDTRSTVSDVRKVSEQELNRVLAGLGLKASEVLQKSQTDAPAAAPQKASFTQPTRLRREQCRKVIRSLQQAGQSLPQPKPQATTGSSVTLQVAQLEALQLPLTGPAPNQLTFQEDQGTRLLFSGEALTVGQKRDLAALCLGAFSSLRR